MKSCFMCVCVTDSTVLICAKTNFQIHLNLQYYYIISAILLLLLLRMNVIATSLGNSGLC